MIELTDSHAHLQEEDFSGDVEEVLHRAYQAGVTRVVVPGVEPVTSAEAARLAEKHQAIFAAAGYHPHDAASWSPEGERQVVDLLTVPDVVAVGEIGLDFYRDLSPRANQERVLRRMLDLAEEFRKPVIIHCREAWPEIRPILFDWARRVSPLFSGRPVGVMHYFSASLAEAREYANVGFMISIHTSVTHPRAGVMREVAAGLDLNSLMIETDSPYGAPQAFRGKRNEPGFLTEAVIEIARLRGLTQDQVAEVTSLNAARLFGLPARYGFKEAAV